MNLVHKVARALAAQIPGTEAAIALAKRQREREMRAAGYLRADAKRLASERRPPAGGAG